MKKSAKSAVNARDEVGGHGGRVESGGSKIAGGTKVPGAITSMSMTAGAAGVIASQDMATSKTVAPMLLLSAISEATMCQLVVAGWKECAECAD